MNTPFVCATASTLAGPGITATFIPAPPATSTVKAADSTRRPNKDDLELILFRAQVRTQQRRLRESLGHGLPSGVARRTTRAVGDSYPSSPPSRRSAPSTPSPLSYPSTPSTTTATTTDTDDAPVSPLYTPLPLPVPTGLPGRPFPEAPSPSHLPTPTFGSPASTTGGTPTTHPRIVQCRPRYGAMDRNHSFVTHGDPALTPRHVFPPYLRRTPGAPVWTDDASSYFRGPVGLGLAMEINVDQEERIEVVEQYCFETAAL